MQRLLIFQSIWAMERRHQDGCEPSIEEKMSRIVDAGYDGISVSTADEAAFLRAVELAHRCNLEVEALCFPSTVDELKPVLKLAAIAGIQHVNLQPNVRPRRLQDCIPLLDGWRRLAAGAQCPVYIETHRDRMTTDLYFTLDLLECFPDLQLVADLSHYLVGREFAWPVSDEHHALIHQILDHAWAFHGRVASREQIQVEISFAHHRPWLDLFLGWWEYGFRSWRRRAPHDATLTFTCELGPQPYAISGPDGKDLSDRWTDALLLRDAVTRLWDSCSEARYPSRTSGRTIE